jgi:hypothetical protein
MRHIYLWRTGVPEVFLSITKEFPTKGTHPTLSFQRPIKFASTVPGKLAVGFTKIALNWTPSTLNPILRENFAAFFHFLLLSLSSRTRSRLSIIDWLGSFTMLADPNGVAALLVKAFHPMMILTLAH